MPQRKIMIQNLVACAEQKDFPVSRLLLNFLDVSNFLNLNEFKFWLLWELNGYSPSAELELPSYRAIQGTIVSKDIRNLTSILEINNSAFQNILREVKVFDSVLRLEGFLEGGRPHYKVLLTKDQIRLLSEASAEPASSAWILVNRGQVATVLREIKLTAKQWIVELQSNT